MAAFSPALEFGVKAVVVHRYHRVGWTLKHGECALGSGAVCEYVCAHGKGTVKYGESHTHTPPP